MSMMDRAGLTPELMDKTRKKAMGRWAVKRTALGVGAAAACAALVLAGWWCLTGIPTPDVQQSNGPAAAAAATADPETTSGAASGFAGMEVIPLRSFYYSEELYQTAQQGLLCLDLGGDPGAALERYELEPDPLLEDGSGRLAAALADGRRFWLVMKISSSGSYLFAPGGITSRDTGDGAPEAEFTMLGCTNPEGVAVTEEMALQGFLLVSREEFPEEAVVTARYQEVDDPVVRPGSSMAGSEMVEYFIEYMMNNPKAMIYSSVQPYAELSSLAAAALKSLCGPELIEYMRQQYEAEMDAPTLRTHLLALFYEELTAGSEPRDPEDQGPVDMEALAGELYGSLDRTTIDGATRYAFVYGQGLDFAEGIPFVAWEAVHQDESGDVCRQLIRVSLAGCTEQKVGWTENDCYYMEFRKNNGLWELAQMVSIGQMDKEAMGLDDTWEDPQCKANLILASGDFLDLETLVKQAVLEANQSHGLSLQIPFEQDMEPGEQQELLGTAQRLLMGSLDPRSLDDNITRVLMDSCYPTAFVKENSSGIFTSVAFEILGSQESSDETTVWLWAVEIAYSISGEDDRMMESGVSVPVKLVFSNKTDEEGFMVPAESGLWVPDDGEGYADSIRQYFEPYADEALAIQQTDIVTDLDTRAREQAARWLGDIGLTLPETPAITPQPTPAPTLYPVTTGLPGGDAGNPLSRLGVGWSHVDINAVYVERNSPAGPGETLYQIYDASVTGKLWDKINGYPDSVWGPPQENKDMPGYYVSGAGGDSWIEAILLLSGRDITGEGSLIIYFTAGGEVWSRGIWMGEDDSQTMCRILDPAVQDEIRAILDIPDVS